MSSEAVSKVTSADPKNQIGEAATVIEDIKGSDDFFWDSVVRYTAAGMVALTILGQAVIALVELIGGTVKCLTPNSSFNRDQSFFINEYCDRYAPVTQYLPWVLILQALAILAPQFMWKSWFTGRLRFFFERAKTLDRDRDSRSGEYGLKNFKIMQALKEEFGKPKLPWMFMSYVFTLAVQLLTVGLATALHATVFSYSVFHPTFFCPPVGDGEVLCTKLGLNNSCVFTTTDTDWPFEFHVHCVLSSLITQRVVWVLNLVLLLLTALAVGIGLIWCFLRHSQYLNWKQAALFSFESSLNADHFVAKPLWNALRRPKLYRISTDFKFLFMKLQRFDAGLAKVLRDVIIAHIVRRKEISSQEEQKYIAGVPTGEEDTIESRKIENEIDQKLDRVEDQECLRFGDTMKTFMRRFVWHLTGNSPDSRRSTNVALDVSFGSPAGYAFLLKQAASMVISLRFDPHYLDPVKNVKVDKYGETTKFGETAMYFVKTSPDIFGQPSKALNDFQMAIQDLFPKSETKINVIVIGPLPKAEEDRLTTLHELLVSLAKPVPVPSDQENTPGEEQVDTLGSPLASRLADNVKLIVLKPKEIESKTSRKFCKFKPASKWVRQPRQKPWVTMILSDNIQTAPEAIPEGGEQQGGATENQPSSPQGSLRSRTSSAHSLSPCCVTVDCGRQTQRQHPENNIIQLLCGETVCTFHVDVYNKVESA